MNIQELEKLITGRRSIRGWIKRGSGCRIIRYSPGPNQRTLTKMRLLDTEIMLPSGVMRQCLFV